MKVSKDMDIEKIVKKMFRSAKRIWEAEVKFWKNSYMRLAHDGFSYLNFEEEDWFEIGMVYTMFKRSEEEVIILLKHCLWFKSIACHINDMIRFEYWINLVTCWQCCNIFSHSIYDEWDLTCPHCNMSDDPCSFPDLFT